LDEKVKIVEFQKVPANKDNISDMIYLVAFETQTGNKGVVTIPASQEISEEIIVQAIRNQITEQRQWKGKELTI